MFEKIIYQKIRHKWLFRNDIMKNESILTIEGAEPRIEFFGTFLSTICNDEAFIDIKFDQSFSK